MMKRTLLLFLLLTIYQEGFAQKEATFWYFGKDTGFDFSKGSPAALANSGMEAFYTTATMSDKTSGALLFYTNGMDVWNRDHQVMPNGRGVIPDNIKIAANRANYMSQGALIVPFPKDSTKYYLFTLGLGVPLWSNWNYYDGVISALYYSVIDMRLDGGKGDVVPEKKNVLVGGGFTEGLTGIIHDNGRDYWIVNHEWASDAFQVRLLTTGGLTEPRRMAVGPTIPFNLQDTTGLFVNGGFKGNFESVAYLRASPNGRKLAITSAARGHVSLFNFNPTTGNITNPIDLGSFIDALSLSFSPDNTKLYVQNHSSTPDKKERNLISQYDLEAGSAADIIASGRSILYKNPNTDLNFSGTSQGGIADIQIGSDGRIYGISSYRSFDRPQESEGERVFVINYPNKKGFEVDIRYKKFDFGDALTFHALPNFMQHYFNGPEPRETDDSACDPDVAVVVFPNPVRDRFKISVRSDCYEIEALTLYAISGQKLGELKAEAATGEIDIGTLAAGVYILKIATKGNDIVKKILKL